jgi:predicted cation transporter
VCRATKFAIRRTHDAGYIMATIGLVIIVALVLVLPFAVKRVERQLEIFLFVMGCLAITISSLWSWNLIEKALVEPIKITLAVLIAGLIFRFIRPKIGKWTHAFARKFSYATLLFIIVVGLGLLSSVITAIIAALILSEVVSVLKLPRTLEVRLVIIACFSIGLGAVLTPIGEPLSTITVSKLTGEPYHAGFFFLLKLLGKWVIPLVVLLGILPLFLAKQHEVKGPTLSEDRPEENKDIFIRAGKVYLFVLALIFLGTGFMPVVDKYLTQIPSWALYWVNIISAVLDNATLAAAEISPKMPIDTIKDALAGLLIAGGMLIPGNIPNIICAGKLSIKSREWAVFGVPLGMIIMVGFFIFLLLT